MAYAAQARVQCLIFGYHFDSMSVIYLDARFLKSREFRSEIRRHALCIYVFMYLFCMGAMYAFGADAPISFFDWMNGGVRARTFFTKCSVRNGRGSHSLYPRIIAAEHRLSIACSKTTNDGSAQVKAGFCRSRLTAHIDHPATPALPLMFYISQLNFVHDYKGSASVGGSFRIS